MRDKLIELIEAGRGCPDDRAPFLYEACLGCRYLHEKDCDIVRLADYLLAHGVTLAEDNNVLGKWIPVSERLPEDSGYYLVVYQDKYNGSISIAFDMYVKCKAGEWWENDFMRDVTHWMPLPEAPKEVE